MRSSGAGGKQSVGVLAPELLMGVLMPEDSSGSIRKRCRCACAYDYRRAALA